MQRIRIDRKYTATLFALFLLIVTTVAAVVLHRNAFERIVEIDSEIEVALKDIHPLFASTIRSEFERAARLNPTYSYFEAEYGDPNFHLEYPFSDAGNSRGSIKGGVIDGPSYAKRTVIMTTADPETDYSRLPISGSLEMVHLEIECKVPWRCFPGRPIIIVTDRAAPKNQTFIEALRELLPEREIFVRTGA